MVVDENDYNPTPGNPASQNYTFVTGAGTGEYYITGDDRQNTFASNANASININQGDTITFDIQQLMHLTQCILGCLIKGDSVSNPAANGEGTATDFLDSLNSWNILLSMWYSSIDDWNNYRYCTWRVNPIFFCSSNRY